MFVVWFIFEHYIPKHKLVYRFCITFDVYKLYFPKFCLVIDFYQITRKYFGSSVLIREAHDILMSSAKSLIMDPILCPTPLMKIRNRRGPSTDP